MDDGIRPLSNSDDGSVVINRADRVTLIFALSEACEREVGIIDELLRRRDAHTSQIRQAIRQRQELLDRYCELRSALQTKHCRPAAASAS